MRTGAYDRNAFERGAHTGWWSDKDDPPTWEEYDRLFGQPDVPADPPPCPVCGETPEIGKPICPCSRELFFRQREAEQEARRQSLWNKAVETHLANAELPTKFAKASFASFLTRPGLEQAVAACQSYAHAFQHGRTSTGLILIGGYGCGKTHLAVATLRHAIERDLVFGRFVSASAAVSRMREHVANGRSGRDFVDEAVDAELLVLDDLGQERATDYARDVLYSIVDGRYLEGRPTIVTSNLGDKQLRDTYGGALLSRLYEMTTLVRVHAEDYRKTPAVRA